MPEIIGPSVWLINTNKIGDDKTYDSDSYETIPTTASNESKNDKYDSDHMKLLACNS